MQADERPDVLGRDGVEVTVGDEDLAGPPDGLLGHEHRVPGPQRVPLLDERRLRRDAPRADGLPDLLGAVVHDDHDLLRTRRPNVLKDPPQRRPTADRMQHLRRRGLQSLALARGQDDRGE